MSEQTPTRVFKIGTTIIIEDEALAERNLDEIKGILKHSYPEVANATIRETPQADGPLLVEFLPVPGRKG